MTLPPPPIWLLLCYPFFSTQRSFRGVEDVTLTLQKCSSGSCISAQSVTLTRGRGLVAKHSSVVVLETGPAWDCVNHVVKVKEV